MIDRNAVIITGFVRDYENTVSSFHKNLMTSDDVDVFIATWDQRGIKAIRPRTVTLTDGTLREIAFKDNVDFSLIDVDDLKDNYHTDFIKVFNQTEFEEAIEPYAKLVETSDLIEVHAKVKPKNWMTLMRRYCMFYMSYQGWKLMESNAKENDINYKKVIKARFDFEKGGYYPRIDWDSNIPDKTIMIGNWNHQLYSQWDSRISFNFQDHFAFGNYSDMMYYFNVFDNLYKLSGNFQHKSKMWHAEYCLSLWLSMNGIKCEAIK